MIIAVDFDGTIVEHKYPKIGKEKPFAIATLKRLQHEGHRITLWTVREGELLQQAVDFCRVRGLEFYTVNANFSDEHSEEQGYSRKIKADIFIDDRNLGGLPDWSTIYEMIHNRWTYERYLNELHHAEEPSNKSFWKRMWGRGFF